MNTRRTLVGLLLIIASVIGVYAQDDKPSFSWGGITISFLPMYNVEDLEFDGEFYFFVINESNKNETALAGFTFGPDDEIPPLTQLQKKALLAYTIKDTSKDTNIINNVLSKGTIEYGLYGDLSASLSIINELDGIKYYNDIIGIIHDNIYVAVTIRTSNINRLEELQDIVKSIKWQ